MHKSKVIEYFVGMQDNSTEGEKLLMQIEEAKLELDSARYLFDSVQDSKLIEMAIYSEEVAKRRYEYLLKLARDMELRVSKDYVLDQCAKLAEQ